MASAFTKPDIPMAGVLYFLSTHQQPYIHRQSAEARVTLFYFMMHL